MEISPDGELAVTTHPGRGGISAIDLERFTVIAEVPTGAAPNYAAFSPDGRKVYVHCWGGVGRTGTVVGCYLVRQGEREADPTVGMPAPRAARRLPRPLPVDDCQALIDVPEPDAEQVARPGVARDRALAQDALNAVFVQELVGGKWHLTLLPTVHTIVAQAQNGVKSG